MSIDLSALSPTARASYIRIGRSYASPDTLAQADRTIGALGSYAPHLAPHGFGQADVQRLKDVRAALVAAGVARTGAQGQKGANTTTCANTMKEGRACRHSARSVLVSARRDLEEEGSAGSQAAVTKIDASLKLTRKAPDEARALAEQLEGMRDLLVDQTVAAAAKDRGGPEVVASIEAVSAALRDSAAARSVPQGTPQATETLDVLDGMVATLCRNALKAARAAARKLGMPAMVASFDLSLLKPSRAAKAPAPSKDAPAPAPAVS